MPAGPHCPRRDGPEIPIEYGIALERARAYLLHGHSCRMQDYASGAELLAKARLREGCILLDLHMPGLSGHEVQEALARRGSVLPGVVMSGQGELAAAVQLGSLVTGK